MRERLEDALCERADRLVSTHERYAKWVHDENVRRGRRSMTPVETLRVRRPEHWEYAPGFNPYIVRSRAPRIAAAVSQALRDGCYEPRRPAGFRVAKADGGTRDVSVFEIADDLVSRRLYQSLMAKNLPRLSARAYAYRADIGVHDAIDFLRTELRGHPRVFVAEFDFTKFFDRIKHDYIRELLAEQRILATSLERTLIDRFIGVELPYMSKAERLVPAPRQVGVPQGTSISLLIANLIASPLDRALEQLGVGFIRYADDTLMWSRDYSTICRAVEELYRAAERIGSPINVKKSPGVRLLVPEETVDAEMRWTTSIGFLGHEVSLRRARMREAAVTKIKHRVQRLLYWNLLDAPLRGAQDGSRLDGHVDKDYVVLIWQLRRYLYGPLTEKDVRRYQRGAIPLMRFKGVMSFFPLVDDDDALRDLDVWIETQAWLAMRRRTRLLVAAGLPTPKPASLSRRDLVRYRRVSTSTGGELDLRMPSVRRIAGVIAQAVATHGTAAVGSGPGLYLYK